MSRFSYALGSLLLAAAAAVSLFGGSSVTVGAASDTVVAVIPVEQTIEYLDSTLSDEFSYLLTAEDVSSPLPDGSENGEFYFSIAKNSTYDLTIEYPSAGDYYYILKGMNDDDPEYKIDPRQYRLLVSVRNSGGGLAAQVLAYTENNKKSAVVFSYTIIGSTLGRTNSYPEKSEPPAESDTLPDPDVVVSYMEENSETEPRTEYSEPQDSEGAYTNLGFAEETGGISAANTGYANTTHNADNHLPLTGDSVLYIGIAALTVLSAGIIVILKTGKRKEK